MRRKGTDVKGAAGRRRTAALLSASFFLLCLGRAVVVAEPLPVTFSFTGNEIFDEARLREVASTELKRVAEEKLWKAAVDDAAYRIESEYHDDGYAFAFVNYEISESEKGREVAFEVEEGPRVLLGEIDFSGNQFFSDEDLAAFFGLGGGSLSESLLSVVTPGAAKAEGEEIPYVKGRVKEAVGSIGDLYYVKGFVVSEISDPEILFSSDRTRADITVGIEEGPQHFVRRVTFSGDLTPETEEDLAKLDASLEGEIFQAARRTALRSRTREIYRIHGYPDVTVEVTEGEGEMPGDVTLEAVIVSGPRVKIAGVDIDGNRKTRESFIRNRVLYEPGDWYSLEKERKMFLSLNRTGIFRSIEGSLEGEEDSEERRLMLTFEEAPSREVALDLGWGSYEKARGQVAFIEKNFFGTGREAGAAVGGSLKGWFVRGRFTDPWFLGTDISASAPLIMSLRDEPSYTEKKIEGGIVLTRKLTQHLSGSLRYSYKLSDIVNLDAEEEHPNGDENYNMGSVTLRFSRDTRNDFFYPSKGKKGSISLEFADPLLGGDVSFVRLAVATSAFFAFGKDTVLALRWDTGFLYPTKEDTAVPISERFFNGGENNVRSFKEDQLGPKDLEGDPTGGLAGNVGTIELRHRLKGNLAGSLFVDIGNIAPNKTRVEQGLPPYKSLNDVVEDAFNQYFSGFRYGVGVGFQYLLPVGPLRMDVAMNPDPEEGDEKWVVHLSLGMSF